MPRHHAEPAVTVFAPLIDDAVRAFCTDLGYATEMAARAVTILTHRKTWVARMITNRPSRISRICALNF